MDNERKLYRPGDKVPATGYYYPNTDLRPVAELRGGMLLTHSKVGNRQRAFQAGDSFPRPDGTHAGNDPGWFWFHE